MRIPSAARHAARGLTFLLPLALLAPAAPAPGDPAEPTDPAIAREARPAVPALRVRTEARGLDIPWDVAVLPDGTRLVTERDRARLSTYADGRLRRTDFPANRVWTSGETGLMSVEVDPDFEDNQRFYTCSGWRSGGGHDVRVNAWKLDGREVTLVKPLVTGFPTSSGRHGGCRLLVTEAGALLVGTGDAAVASNPRNKRSLGGKTLRLDRFTGRPWPTNPFVGSQNRRKRYVYTYGHRNVQGLAQRDDGTLWSVEQGTYRDDEVNLLRKGGDYGWNPGPGYDESAPMTDRSLPGRQRAARWRSGNPTLATSGGTWVRGREWGRLRGTLAVAALKASRVVFMKFDDRGRLRWTRAPRSLHQDGRLRSIERTPGNALLITTGNGGGKDKVLRVTPRR